MKNAWKLVSALILLASLNTAEPALSGAKGPESGTCANGGGQAQMRAGTGRYGCSEKDIAHYVCRRAAGRITIDGRLDEPSWQKAEKSPRFVDMVTESPASTTREPPHCGMTNIFTLACGLKSPTSKPT